MAIERKVICISVWLRSKTSKFGNCLLCTSRKKKPFLYTYSIYAHLRFESPIFSAVLHITGGEEIYIYSFPKSMQSE